MPLTSDSRALGRTGLAVVATCFAFNIFSRGVGDAYTVMLVPLEREFGWSRAELTGVYSLYLLVSGAVSPAVGLLFDRYGPRVVYAAGLSLVGLALIVAGGLNRLWQFYAAIGCAVGVGVGLVGMVPASALLARWYRSRLASMIGVVFSAAGLGALILVPLTQFVVLHYEWRLAYRLLGSAVIVFAVIQMLAVPWRRFEGGHPRVRGALEADPTRESWTVRKALRSPFYWSLVRVFFFTSVGMYAVLVQLIAYLTDVGFSPLAASTCFGVMGLLSVVSVMTSGMVADRWGLRRTAIVSFAGTAAGMILLLLLSFRAWPAVLGAIVITYGLFQGTRGPLISSLAAKYFAGPRAGTIYGTILATNAVGAALGALAAGVLHDATGGYRASLLLSLGSIVLAALPFWSVRELRELRG